MAIQFFSYILVFTSVFIVGYIAANKIAAIFSSKGNEVDVYSNKDSFVIKITMRLGTYLRENWSAELPNRADNFKKKIHEAGNFLDLNDGYDVIALKLVCAAALSFFVFIFLFLMTGSLFLPLFLAAITACLGYMYPSAVLDGKAAERKKKFLRQLPNAIDILSVCADAGMDFITSISYVIKCYVSGPVQDEFQTMQRELSLGKSQAAALAGITKRMNIAEVTTVLGAISQAIEMGTPMAEMLRLSAQEMRKKRALAAEEEAKKAVVKMTLPLLLLVLPGVFIVLLGPIARELTATLGTFR
ncbi:MAG: type II secretion system F family protein [Lentisphaeria bacterium]|jgi:tight adherence protein C